MPPYNTRGRQSGGARFIKTRTDYSIASTFDTNQKIMMHGLRNSRTADLRKIKLRLLLKRLLQWDPNKGHSTNLRYISSSRKSYVITSCYLTRTHMNTASKSENQNSRPDLGIWHKTGYTLCILFILSLRRAEINISPNQSPWTITVVNST